MYIYNPKARMCAFIFVDGKLYLATTHTECVINILIDRKFIKNDKQFYKLLNSEKEKNQKLVKSWSDAIEINSIFGELSYYNKELSVFIFDEVTTYGLKCLTEVVYKQYGCTSIYKAIYDISVQNHFRIEKII